MLDREFAKDPVRFFKTVIMPLLPKESKLKFDQEGVIQWKSLLGGSDPMAGADDGDADEGDACA